MDEQLPSENGTPGTPPPEGSPFNDGAVVHNIKEAIGDLSMVEWFKKIKFGIHQSKDTGAYKFAHQEMLRLWSPISGIALPAALVIAMLLMPTHDTGSNNGAVEVQVLDTESVKLDDIKPVEEQVEPIKPPPPIDDINIEALTISDNTAAAPGTTAGPGQGNSTAFSPQPAEFDSVAMVKSPVIMRGIYGSRTPGARGSAMAKYGGGIAGGVTEGAVLRALRWLKKYQDADGKWTQGSGGIGGGTQGGGAPAAMTGLALLTFLAHGETPASEEFGPTVEKAIQWLVKAQLPDGGWTPARHYEHQIATYAIAEAYALTKIPALKDSATRGLDVIVRGQNAVGGWNYPLLATDTRTDTSVGAWCCQALKAGKMGGLDNPGLEACIKKAIDGFKGQADPNGGFTYATTIPPAGAPHATALTGAATLSLQFLGAAKLKETRAGIKYLTEKRIGMDWKTAKWTDVYWWYYDTQARFHEGGDLWDKWNKIFALELVKNQTILKGEGVDGKDIGYWHTTDDPHGLVLDTTLCALQLQVYYRYLPTYRPPVEDDKAAAPEEDAVNVDVKL